MAAIKHTDKFILQRPSSYSGVGSASSDVFSVSAEQIALFSAGYGGVVYDDLADRQDYLEDQMKDLVDKWLPTVTSDLTDHDIRISVNEDNILKLDDHLGKTDKRIDDALAKAQINIYHKLVDNDTPDVGEMCVFQTNTSTGGDLATKFGDVVKIRYNIIDIDGVPAQFENIWKGETLEISNLNQSSATLTHRAVFYISNVEPYLGTYIDIEVEARHSNADDLPFYQEADSNPTRSDFYPIFTVQEDTILAAMEDYLPLEGGTLTGDLTISTDGSSDSRLSLETPSGIIRFKTTLTIRDESDAVVMDYGSGYVACHQKLMMHNKKITELAPPTNKTDAANKEYVDDAIAGFDITKEDLFKPGDRVAEVLPNNTEQYGFYFQDNTLFFKTSTT